MKKRELKMNTSLHLGLPILHISQTLMYEFWYYYIKPKYGARVKLYYTDIDSLVIYINI